MSRKWFWVHMIMILVLLSFLGCASGTRPDTTPEDLPVTETSPPEATEVSPAPSPATDVDATPSPWEGTDYERITNEAYEKGLLGEIYFDFDKYNLKPQARERLAKNARFLNEHEDLLVTIEGHCDERGTNEYNIGLGERRADAARDYLASLGVDRSRLRVISYGEERPVCTESTEACWQRNRRAYFAVTGRR